MKSVRVDVSGCFLERTGLSARDLVRLAPRLEAARADLLVGNGARDWALGLTQEYDAQRFNSTLYRVLRAAHRLRDEVDAVAIVGGNGWDLGAKALMAACSAPYFNEHPRGERGSRQRLYFAADDFDNDGLRGLTHVLRGGSQAGNCAGLWALMAIAAQRDPANPATADTLSGSHGVEDEEAERGPARIAYEWLARELRNQSARAGRDWTKLVVPILGAPSPWTARLDELRSEHTFRLAEGLTERGAIFSAATLLPAALLGIDIVRFLRGAIQLREQFRKAPVGSNPVLDLVGIGYLLERRCGTQSRALWAGAQGLRGAVDWWRHGDEPFRWVMPTHRWGTGIGRTSETLARRAWLTRWCVEQWRCDPLPGRPDTLSGCDESVERGQESLPDRALVEAARERGALREAGQPQVEVWLPSVDESSLGQLFELYLLAESLEQRFPSRLTQEGKLP